MCVCASTRERGPPPSGSLPPTGGATPTAPENESNNVASAPAVGWSAPEQREHEKRASSVGYLALSLTTELDQLRQQ